MKIWILKKPPHILCSYNVIPAWNGKGVGETMQMQYCADGEEVLEINFVKGCTAVGGACDVIFQLITARVSASNFVKSISRVMSANA
jgi:hypothetical protein